MNYDANADLPGYFVDDPQGTVCVPFTPAQQQPPAGYQGNFYVDEFTDAAVKAKWAACAQDPTCKAGIEGLAAGFVQHQFRVTGTVDPFGKIDPEGDVNLADIRRPGYFARAPYIEPIAAVEDQTYTV